MKVNLVKVDNFCDCLPLVSTVTNLINLFQKAVLWCCKVDGPTNSKAPENHYYTHLDHKSVFTCIQLMIPVLGNISVALTKHSQSIQAQSREGLLKLIDSDPYYLHTCGSDHFKKNGDFMLEAVKRGAPEVVRWAAPELLEDRDFMLNAAQIDVGVLKWCSLKFLADAKFANEIMDKLESKDQNLMINHFKELHRDKKFVLYLIENNSGENIKRDINMSTISNNFPDDMEVFKAALEKCGMYCFQKFPVTQVTEDYVVPMVPIPWIKNKDMIEEALKHDSCDPCDIFTELKKNEIEITGDMIEMAINKSSSLDKKIQILNFVGRELGEETAKVGKKLLEERGMEMFKDESKENQSRILICFKSFGVSDDAMVDYAAT